MNALRELQSGAFILTFGHVDLECKWVSCRRADLDVSVPASHAVIGQLNETDD